MTNYNEYNRGSEWRRWDLHIHTPASIYQKYGSNDNETWEKYISDIENLSSDFAVLGINDYFFIDGYERVKKDREEKNILSKIHKILPVVEFRIDKFAGIDFGQLKRINLHVIFSDEIPIETIKSQFLNTLEQSYYLESGEQWTRAITRESVEELGKQIKAKVPATELYKYGSDLNEGFNNLNIKEERIFDALKKNCFEGRYLIAIGKTEWGELKWTDASIATKKSIINRADIVFTASASPEDHKNAKEKLGKQEVKDLLLDCSDAHNFSNSTDKDRIGNCFNWIKADPTFEGLKQIIYEPNDRIAVQTNLPEEKAGYQVIDRIEISNSKIVNSILHFNSNLNSIIGGRSTGKSILLAAIAKKLKSPQAPKIDNPDYNQFVNDVKDKIVIYWKDGEINDERDIEYFPQSYMNSLSTENEKLNKLIQDILKQKGKEHFLKLFDGFCEENRSSISEYISQIFRADQDIRDKESKAKEKGDKKGIDDEINKISEEIKSLNKGDSLDENDLKIYNDLKNEIEELLSKNQKLENDFQFIEGFKIKEVFKTNFEYETVSLTDNNKQSVNDLFNQLKAEFEDKWKAKLAELLNGITNEIVKNKEKISSNEINEIYLKGIKAFAENTLYKGLEERLKIQHEKLVEIVILTKEIEELKKQRNSIKESILKSHQLYFVKINETVSNLSDSYDGLEISAKPKFKSNAYYNLLQNGLNLKGSQAQEIVNYEYNNNEGYEKHIFELFDNLLLNNISLKSGYSNVTLLQQLLTNNFYEITYDIVYENDSFVQMSEGKKAFVVLKLLLDFSDKNCPILIDQPEDDLDNRAIYTDLVKYLKKKKKERQIIVVTHNPNIVVGADSELVIVANQHGIKTKNVEDKKFQYVAGSLEFTKKKNEGEEILLFSQGIREHVCEILEGGDDAFKQRELKYAIKKVNG